MLKPQDTKLRNKFCLILTIPRVIIAFEFEGFVGIVYDTLLDTGESIERCYMYIVKTRIQIMHPYSRKNIHLGYGTIEL